MNFEEKVWIYKRRLQEQRSEYKEESAPRYYFGFIKLFSKLLRKLTAKGSIDDRIG